MPSRPVQALLAVEPGVDAEDVRDSLPARRGLQRRRCRHRRRGGDVVATRWQRGSAPRSLRRLLGSRLAAPRRRGPPESRKPTCRCRPSRRPAPGRATPWTLSIESEKARWVPVICESTEAVSLAAKSVDVICWPGKMSTAAARPARYDGSATAPISTSFAGSVVGRVHRVRRDDRARRSRGNQPVRDEHRRRGVPATDAGAVAIQVDDEQDRGERDSADAEGDRPSARRHPARDLSGERVGHGFSSPWSSWEGPRSCPYRPYVGSSGLSHEFRRADTTSCGSDGPRTTGYSTRTGTQNSGLGERAQSSGRDDLAARLRECRS